MHDIGKLLIIRVIDGIKRKYPNLPITNAFLLDVVGSLHSKMGYALMKHWSIHEQYCKVALSHHTDDFDINDVLLMAVRIANQACIKLGVNTTHERPIPLPALREVNILNIQESLLTEVEAVIEGAAETRAAS